MLIPVNVGPPFISGPPRPRQLGRQKIKNWCSETGVALYLGFGRIRDDALSQDTDILWSQAVYVAAHVMTQVPSLGQVLIIVPTRLLLEQFAPEFPTFCKVGMGYNHKIRKQALGFIAVSNSVHLLQHLKFDAIFVDEAHHSLPQGMPPGKEVFFFSATQRRTIDFEYSMGQAIEDDVLCDYDLTVPVVDEGHAYGCLASLLLSSHGRFRRVLAYCNTVKEAKRTQQVFATRGICAWHINSDTRPRQRQAVINEFCGSLQGPVHVLVTVQVLGEGVNIPNADTCMFVEPRNSYSVIVQAIGRVLRHHASKPTSHIIFPQQLFLLHQRLWLRPMPTTLDSPSQHVLAVMLVLAGTWHPL